MSLKMEDISRKKQEVIIKEHPLKLREQQEFEIEEVLTEELPVKIDFSEENFRSDRKRNNNKLRRFQQN